MRKIWNWLVGIPADKWMHFCAGAGIDLYAFAVAYRFVPLWAAFVIAFSLALVALVGKEIYDKLHPDGHSVEFKDILAGVIGCLLVDGALAVMLI